MTMTDEGIGLDDLDAEFVRLVTSLARAMTGRRITPGLAGAPSEVDLVVVGLGITGAGVALDAVTRGLTVLAVDAHDLAFGTSRWSSKLVHGGLRYLAQGRLAIAHESAVERGILMDVTAPHLVHPLPMLTPVDDAMSRGRTAMTWAGLQAGDALRRAARTSTRTLPRPRRLNATETLNLAPALRADTLRGGLLAWDGQLEDDARLVTTVARTAAAHGAEVRTRARVTGATGTRVEMRDELTGATHVVRARAVVNATGVWAGDLDDQVRLRPSRGTHLVLRGLDAPPHPGRGAGADPRRDGPLRDGAAAARRHDLRRPHRRAGHRPRARRAGAERGRGRLPPRGRRRRLRHAPDPRRRRRCVRRAAAPAGGRRDRRHLRPVAAPRDPHLADRGDHGRRRQAHDLPADGRRTPSTRWPAPSPTPAPAAPRRCPLLGAAAPDELRRSTAPARLVRRFGTDADLVLATAREVTGLPDDELLAPASAQVPVTLAELVFAITHEGAHDVDDLLERRTRVGLVAADRAIAEPLARRALGLVARDPHDSKMRR